ncbi:uncharacterized protein C8Q71DRAFT_823077 [Rhodofomes roseus]|uniref:Uncharacterized protein n=1 Tax=Rhodofomes roseus TaxID=34475 RepID=A0ABQ8KDB8_9APHY|nr:uncharacterized protein C8Q71DRAFT_823077 [Rhodofomes roseus]KAH9835262.1 hypothetical protein C8Q71DRAFT_823077 [Rhodofomes roseus]
MLELREVGRCIASRLANEGLIVAVNDLPNKLAQLEAVALEIRSSTGSQAIAVTGDVSSEENVQAMVAAVVEQLGGLDVMIANAGITGFRSLLDRERVGSINARGVMLCYKHAAKQMVEQGRGGRIIGIPSLSAYAASKSAVRGLTQCAALELAAHKITRLNMPTNMPMADHEVIASVVSYLAKPESYFITGQTISVNGGTHCD